MAIIDALFEKGILVSPEVMDNPDYLLKLENMDESELRGVDVIDENFFDKFKKKEADHFKVLMSYDKKPSKISVTDFVSYFNRRFEGLSSFLRQRMEFQGTMSISKLKQKKEKEKISAIGLVYEKAITKKNSVILTLEDPTGTISVLVRPDKKELYEIAKEAVLDELIGVEGTISGNYIFANNIIHPDIPATKELKKGPDEEYVILIGDLHFGAKVFLTEEYNNFLEWINGRKGSPEQREIASKVKYAIFIGDLVEGVGIYPNQEKDLDVYDIYDQYNLFVESMKKIPSRITCFVCPGNHDASRLSEPQPPLNTKYIKGIEEMDNVVLTSSPALIRLGIKKNFPGFDFLIYHGYSLVYYADNVESIRSKGGQKRPDLIMKCLLQKRHLAPSHTSNLYIPDTVEDPLIVKDVPDFFITGHIHRMSAGQYKNITLVNCSCWNDITDSQEKRGLEPQPGKLPVINLRTREVKIINFMKEEKPEVMNDDANSQESNKEEVKV